MKTEMAERDIPKVHDSLSKMHSGLSGLCEKVMEDHREEQVCMGYGDFVKSQPLTWLNRAREKLARKDYQVGFVGIFKGGKSTLINSILDEPDLLSEAVTECTMSITIITEPHEGEQERVEVKYYGIEDGYRNLARNPRYELLVKGHQEKFDKFTEGAAGEAIREVIADLRKRPDWYKKELDFPGTEDVLKRAIELEEFLEYRDKLSARLGRVHTDDLGNIRQYLTVDESWRGMGHLLWIERVFVFKHNPLFAEKGVRIVDTPGTGVLNPRQIELTHEYLQQADAVVMVIETKGVARDYEEIKREFEKHHNEIRNKVFCVMNKFDLLGLNEISRPEMERQRNQVLGALVDLGLSTKWVYLTSSKRAKLLSAKRLGVLGTDGARELEMVEKDCAEKLRRLDRTISKDWLEKMEKVYVDGGITDFKKDLLKYLEKDIRTNRLEEIYTDLYRVYGSLDSLLDAERLRVQDLLEVLMDKRSQIVEMVARLEERVSSQVRGIDEKLPLAVQSMVNQAKEKMLQKLNASIDAMRMDKIKASLLMPTPRAIKTEAIALCKAEFSRRFAETMQEAVVGSVSEKVKGELAATGVPELLIRFSKMLEVPFDARYEDLVKTFVQNVRQFTYMRAVEETWPILEEPIIVPPDQTAKWTDQMEKEFRADLKKVFTERFLAAANRFAGVMWKHYKLLLEDLLASFGRLAGDLTKKLKAVQDEVTIPIDLLFDDEAKKEKSKEYKLAEYLQKFEGIRGAMQPLSDMFGIPTIK